jgi:DNA-binding NarL/FixJ family response regulator
VIGVLLLEDHTAFRQALALTLEREPDLRIVGHCGTLCEARCFLSRVGPADAIDVAVIDLDLPDGNGAEVISELHRVNREALDLVLTASAGPTNLARAVGAGAAGVLHKTTPIPEVIAAIRRMANSELLLTRPEITILASLARQQEHETQRARQAL